VNALALVILLAAQPGQWSPPAPGTGAIWHPAGDGSADRCLWRGNAILGRYVATSGQYFRWDGAQWVDPQPMAAPAVDVVGDSDDVIFARLQARIDSRVEQRLTAAVEEAASDKQQGIGSALAVALGKLVLKVVRDIIGALVLAAVVALLWSHWWIVTGLFALVTSVASAAGWLGGRKAAKGP
jgi:hypothetical protein